MKSNKQRRAEILEHRRKRDAKVTVLRGDEREKELPMGTAPCCAEFLAASNSYGEPEFAVRGYYVDVLFKCCDCDKQEIWRATQQKWWYEVARGNVESRAVRCNACRRIERARSAEARRASLEGLARKRALGVKS
jgi:hypothetical protein